MNTKTKPYQLTKYPIGSLREIWAVSWPLMLSLASTSLMNFADRAYLAYYSVDAMNAVTIAGTYAFILMAFLLTVCEITNVFVGKFHGKSEFDKVGRPIWQMIWLALFSWPLFFITSRFAATYLFNPGSLESIYFVRYLDFGPSILCSFAIMGFFLGTGRTRVITISTFLTNLLNALLAPLLIFGLSVVPSMGIEGAAIATGLSQSMQALFLLSLFLQKKHRVQYKTSNYSFDRALLKKMLFVGVPTGTGRTFESIAHGFFFYMIALAGSLELTCATIAQSFYMLVIFCVYGISKAVTAIISNLVGAEKHTLVPKAINSAVLLHSILFCLLFLFCHTLSESVLSFILNPNDLVLLEIPEFVASVKKVLYCMSLFFLLKGFSWIMVGHLTALGQTKFVMYVNGIMHWIGYIVPVYFFVSFYGLGALGGWLVIVLNSFLIFSIFWRRSSSMHHTTQKNIVAAQ